MFHEKQDLVLENQHEQFWFCFRPAAYLVEVLSTVSPMAGEKATIYPVIVSLSMADDV